MGCARWDFSDSTRSATWQLPSARLPPDAVVVEVAFGRIRAAEASSSSEFWNSVDEQRLDHQLRRLLLANGIRCGVVSQPLPAWLRQMIDFQGSANGGHTAAAPETAADVTARQYRLQMRAGQRSSIQLTSATDVMTVLWTDGEAWRGETFRDALASIWLTCYPRGDGRVRMELVPIVEHGPLRVRPIGADGLWHVEYSKDKHRFDWLTITTELAPGEILALAASPEPVGLGKTLFQRDSDDRVWLFLRVAQVQDDDLFQPNEITNSHADAAALSHTDTAPVPAARESNRLAKN